MDRLHDGIVFYSNGRISYTVRPRIQSFYPLDHSFEPITFIFGHIGRWVMLVTFVILAWILPELWPLKSLKKTIT